MERAMTLHEFPRVQAFEPGQLNVMTEGFDAVCRELRLSGREGSSDRIPRAEDR
jgi:hypothetical protein